MNVPHCLQNVREADLELTLRSTTRAARRWIVRKGHLTGLLLYVATVPTGTANVVHGTSRVGEVLTQSTLLR